MLKHEVDEAKREGLIGTIIQQGACKCCGQLMKIETIIDWDEDRCHELATEKCDCEDAKEYTRKKYWHENANKKISLLFENKKEPVNQEAVGLMRNTVDLLIDNKLESVSIDLGQGVKAKLCKNSKGKIKVERTNTVKMTEEA